MTVGALLAEECMKKHCGVALANGAGQQGALTRQAHIRTDERGRKEILIATACSIR